jgi:predicted membrane protein
VIDERRLAVAFAVAFVHRMTGKGGNVEVPEVMHGVLISGCLELYKNPAEPW